MPFKAAEAVLEWDEGIAINSPEKVYENTDERGPCPHLTLSGCCEAELTNRRF
jgi:hypothetical protein